VIGKKRYGSRSESESEREDVKRIVRHEVKNKIFTSSRIKILFYFKIVLAKQISYF